MDKFAYTLKVQELHKLTTKKAKQDFISDVKLLASYYTNTPFYVVKLVVDIRDTLTDTKLTGVKSLPKILSDAITYSTYSAEELSDLSAILPKTAVTAGNDYSQFMRSSGIPAYLKVAVLAAQK